MDFREDFLQLVWKYQYFDKRGLKTTDNEIISITKVGFHNSGGGPDFLEATISLNGLSLHGHVEIHKRASDWKQHSHDSDPAYNSVILHVVWEEDKPVRRNDGTAIATLELKGRIFLDVWKKYRDSLDFRQKLPCASGISEVPDIIRFSTLEKALVERLEEKSNLILNILNDTKGDWEETAYRWLFRCFGFKRNADSMQELAELVLYKTLKKHRPQVSALEAMLFGQAGLLPDESSEPYVDFLKKEFAFFKEKYSWDRAMKYQNWDFARVRPGNFPTLRIAQLASILSKAPDLHGCIFEDTQDFESLKRVFQVEPSDFWKYHYSFAGQAKKAADRKISNTVIHLLMINFVTPLWFSYGRYFDQSDWKERCFDLLQSLPAESNSIIGLFENAGWEAGNGFDTQGMIGLYKNYCTPKKCLQCKVGQSLIKAD
ncbi:DUF2851 family protein [Algoriphagus sediminis]|uniref:DUF2851 family protein n=1 Tax=Algoriphagus sediminis TaxID=3057113 RepID=A0ABT7YFA5_9BACT|nr:DUF2851 family protein [Algoriphagus sediminis]MDN3205204.1 DUF2851 family protein [Algoriphagus sediminis]